MMPRRRLRLTDLALPILACALAVSTASGAYAEEGFFDRLLGGTPGAAPPNPFASNYSSAPPSPAEVRAAREARAIRRARRDAEVGPVPPGRIPGE